MLLEIVKPVALLSSILSLWSVFRATFLIPNASELLFSDAAQADRILHAIWLLFFAAGICLASGLLFREASPRPRPSLVNTLPVQLLCWSAGAMLALFVASWYLETHVIFYRNISY